MTFESYFSSYLDLCLKGAVIVLIALAAGFVWRRASAANRNVIWLAVMAALLLLPLTKFANPRWVYASARSERTTPLELRPDAAAGDVVAPFSNRRAFGVGGMDGMDKAGTPNAASLLWLAMAGVVWVSGVALMLAKRAGASWKLRMFVRRSRPVSEERMLALAWRLAGGKGMHLDLRESEECRVPLVFGVWKPAVVLPVEARLWSPEKLSAVLLHEFGHLRRRDCSTRLLMDLVCAFYWINPLVWLAARQMRMAQEQACDDLVLRAGVCSMDYASQLVEIVRHLSDDRLFGRHAIAMAQPSTLEVRVRAIVDSRRNRHSMTRLAVVSGGMALIAALSLCGAAQLKGAEAKDSAPYGWKRKVTDASAVILHAADGGKSWTDVSPDALKREVKTLVAGNREDALADISSLCPIDNRHAWLAIALGKVILMEYTADAGRHWKETRAPMAADAVKISFLDESRGFLLVSSSPAAGLMSKLVYGTEDGGQKWRRLPSPKAVSYYTTGISFRSPSDGWITGTYHGGDDAPLYQTRDGGKSWRLQKLDIPADFRGGYADTYPPVFMGKDRKRGWLPVKLVRHEPAPDRESWVNYLSEDGGETWRLPKTGVRAARR